METFTQWVESWFQQSLYKINDQVYNVPKLAEWAKKNLQVTQLSISDIQRRYIWADKLFIDNDDPQDDWASRSMKTDLSWPILMLQYPDGKWEIIDGNHRTWKAWKIGEKSISGYIIPSDKLPPPDQI